MSNDDGKHLMLEFQASGNSDACRRLFLQYRDPVWRFLLRLSGSEADANDMSQRTWLKVIEAAERNAYRPTGSATFQTWLLTIARNIFIDEVRTLRAKSEHIGDDEPARLADDSGQAIDEIVDDLNAEDDLRSAFKTLPVEQREVLAMWAEGFQFDEIASVVGAPRNTVIGRKKYGMEKLRAAMPRNLGIERMSETD